MHQPERRPCTVASGILISLFSCADSPCIVTIWRCTHCVCLLVCRANSWLLLWVLRPSSPGNFGRPAQDLGEANSPGGSSPTALVSGVHSTLPSLGSIIPKPHVSSWLGVAWAKNVTVFFVVHQKHRVFCALLF